MESPSMRGSAAADNDALARIEFLYAAAHAYAQAAPALSQSYFINMKNVASRARIKLAPSIERSFCGKCGALFAGHAKVRVGPAKRKQKGKAPTAGDAAAPGAGDNGASADSKAIERAFAYHIVSSTDERISCRSKRRVRVTCGCCKTTHVYEGATRADVVTNRAASAATLSTDSGVKSQSIASTPLLSSKSPHSGTQSLVTTPTSARSMSAGPGSAGSWGSPLPARSPGGVISGGISKQGNKGSTNNSHNSSNMKKKKASLQAMLQASSKGVAAKDRKSDGPSRLEQFLASMKS